MWNFSWWDVIIIAFLWAVASIWWLMETMGYKYRDGKWYDYPLCIPVLVIANIIGFLRGCKCIK